MLFDLLDVYPELRFRDPDDLIQVMKDIFSKTKCPFVILIDEWDCLFREYKQDKEAQKKYLDFLKAFGNYLKLCNQNMDYDEVMQEYINDFFYKQRGIGEKMGQYTDQSLLNPLVNNSEK